MVYIVYIAKTKLEPKVRVPIPLESTFIVDFNNEEMIIEINIIILEPWKRLKYFIEIRLTVTNDTQS